MKKKKEKSFYTKHSHHSIRQIKSKRLTFENLSGRKRNNYGHAGQFVVKPNIGHNNSIST